MLLPLGLGVLAYWARRDICKTKGRLFVLLLVWNAFVFSVFCLPLFLPLLLLPPSLLPRPLWKASRRLYRWGTDLFQGQWTAFVVAMTEGVMGVKVSVHVMDTALGPTTNSCLLPFNESMILISNHHCRTDWLFLWCLLLRSGGVQQLATLRVVLKAALKAMPFLGWAMQSFLYIFLARDQGGGDIPWMREVLSYITRFGLKSSVLLFPEGTDLSPSNVLKSHKYAEEKSLSPLHHVLHPKVKGFAEVVEGMAGGVDAVYDVTLAYEYHEDEEEEDGRREGGGDKKGKKQKQKLKQQQKQQQQQQSKEKKKDLRISETDLLAGRFPRHVHFLVKRFSSSRLVSSSREELEGWCQAMFYEKEAELAYFKAHGCWKGACGSAGDGGESKTGGRGDGCGGGGGGGGRGSKVCKEYESPVSVKLACCGAVAFYTYVSLVTVLGVVAFPWCRWYALASLCVLVLVTAAGGLDRLEVFMSPSATEEEAMEAAAKDKKRR